MMIPRACDICQQELSTELVQFETVRGMPVNMPRRQWTVAPRSGGLSVRMICQPCCDYLIEGIEQLRQRLLQHGGWDGVPGSNAHAS